MKKFIPDKPKSISDKLVEGVINVFKRAKDIAQNKTPKPKKPNIDKYLRK